MKVKEFVSILQGCNPESDITLSFGRNDEYVRACARIALNDPNGEGVECLKQLEVSDISLIPTDEGCECIINMESGYYTIGFIRDYYAKVNNEPSK